MKKKSCLILILVVLITALTATSAFAENTTPATTVQFRLNSNTYSVNNQTYTMEVTPLIINGRTCLPISYLANSLGITDVKWDASTQTVTLKKDGKTVQLTIGQTTLKINGQDFGMDSQPTIQQGRTYLPAVFIAESFGFNVSWDGALQAVNITSSTGNKEVKTITFQDGSKYVGPTVDGVPNGKGTAYYSNGDVYEGDFVNGIMQGTGKYTYKNGNIYVGEMANNKHNGFGSLYTPIGSRLDCKFKDNLPTGEGTWHNPDGTTYKQTF